jgi:hypothetical protein
MTRPVDPMKLRVGSKVKLRGSKGIEPRKPWPRGWREVVELDLPDAFKVASDERWLPTELIEETAL